MLAYSLRQHDPIYIIGYVFNVVPYTRNLVLIRRKRREDRATATRNYQLPIVGDLMETVSPVEKE